MWVPGTQPALLIPTAPDAAVFKSRAANGKICRVERNPPAYATRANPIRAPQSARQSATIPTSADVMKLLRILVSACFGASALTASERGEVKMTCPLDGVSFVVVQDFSGYAAGMRLDLRKMGAISQPWALARCPECGLPLFQRHFTDAETSRLKEIVASGRFFNEARAAPAWFALGVLKEELKADPYEIGWTYLNASWEAENEARPEAYARAAQRAIAWFDRAAPALKDQPARSKDWHIALYLPVELTRRLGDFAQAARRLHQLPDLRGSGIDWLPAALQTQARLIAAKDKSAEEEAEAPRVK